MKHLVFLLEEQSARDLLEGLLPRLLPESTSVYYLVFEGKQDLEGQLVRKLKGWRQKDSAFVVLRDQDAGECRAVKERLNVLVAESSRQPVLVRVACRELEAWALGDWQAVSQAFDRPQLKAQSAKEPYRNPDQLVRPVEELRKFIPEYQNGTEPGGWACCWTRTGISPRAFERSARVFKSWPRGESDASSQRRHRPGARPQTHD